MSSFDKLTLINLVLFFYFIIIDRWVLDDSIGGIIKRFVAAKLATVLWAVYTIISIPVWLIVLIYNW